MGKVSKPYVENMVRWNMARWKYSTCDHKHAIISELSVWHVCITFEFPFEEIVSLSHG